MYFENYMRFSQQFSECSATIKDNNGFTLSYMYVFNFLVFAENTYSSNLLEWDISRSKKKKKNEDMNLSAKFI